jgi:hypothetical protein
MEWIGMDTDTKLQNALRLVRQTNEYKENKAKAVLRKKAGNVYVVLADHEWIRCCIAGPIAHLINQVDVSKLSVLEYANFLLGQYVTAIPALEEEYEQWLNPGHPV